jgi:hypothetical protein
MDADPTAALQNIRHQFATSRRKTNASEAATTQILANGRVILDRGHNLLAWFSDAERTGWIPSPRR